MQNQHYKPLIEQENRLEHKLSLTEVNKLFYAAACAVCGTLGIKMRKNRHKKKKPSHNEEKN